MMNFTIGARLGIAFGFLLVIMVALALLGISGMTSIQTRLKEITEKNNVELEAARIMQISAFERTLSLRNLNIALLPEAASASKEEVELNAVDRSKKEALRIEGERANFKTAADTLKDLYSKSVSTSEEKIANFSKLNTLESEVIPLENGLLEAMQQRKGFDVWFPLVKKGRNLLRSLLDNAGALNEQIKVQNQQSVIDANVAYESSRAWLIALSSTAMVLAVLLAWLITRSITVPLKNAVLIAQTVASGDLSIQVSTHSNDEIGQMMQALKEMTRSLAGLVAQVNAGAVAIASASSQIAEGNHDLSSRTEMQASALEETAASMGEMTSIVKRNLDNIKLANQLAETASDVATKGGVVVDKVVETMSGINESAQKIASIISVIDGISFQTNILALNAAVEAARAGEQGRGFAVVAAEVRMLAQRSAVAAKEIKLLITDSVAKVEKGSSLVREAGTTMDDIVGSVKRATEVMRGIMTLSQEQSLGIQQINEAIGQMDTATQQNAALVEQAAAAAASMQEQASALVRIVSIFKTEKHTVETNSLRQIGVREMFQ